MERILLASEPKPDADTGVDVFIASEEGTTAVQFKFLNDLRANGHRAAMEQAGRSLKGQLKQADRIGAAKVVIVARDEVRVRDMQTGETQVVETLDDAAKLL
jgi:histidyl-tRNA synthetase